MPDTLKKNKKSPSKKEVALLDTKCYPETEDHDPLKEESSVLDTDEPPIGVGGGSFFIELPYDEVVISDKPSGTTRHYNTTYNKYPFIPKGHRYTSVGQLRILTELLDRGKVSYCIHTIDDSYEASLNLWLTGNLTDIPDIIIQGVNGGAILTQKSLVNAPNSKRVRVRYYNDASDSHAIKLRRWQVVRDGAPNEEILSGDDDQDLYYLHVYFNHYELSSSDKNIK